MRSPPLMYRPLAALAVTIAWGSPYQASPASAQNRIAQICPLIESAARANTLPVDFFARLIWQESHFRPDVKGPVTATGQRAEGIAQFMPATAAEHNLTEPFNPSAALPKSGEFLAKLREQFGNLGLAAAAYNAGPGRVRDYLSGTKSLPAETRNYVYAITGHSVEEWSKAAFPPANTPISGQPVAADPKGVATGEPGSACRDLMAHLDQASAHLPLQPATLSFERQIRRISYEPQTSRVIQETARRYVPSWCSGLRHPNVSECGNVHLREPATRTPGLLAHAEPHRPISHIHLPRVSLR